MTLADVWSLKKCIPKDMGLEIVSGHVLVVTCSYTTLSTSTTVGEEIYRCEEDALVIS
jgi:hypothetical protein